MLQILKQQRQGACIVALRGEAGLAEAQTLTESIIELAAERPAVLVFDLSGLKFVSSLALGEFASLAGALRRHECRLAIAGALPMVRTALHRFRLATSYEMADSVEHALAEIAGVATADVSAQLSAGASSAVI